MIVKLATRNLMRGKLRTWLNVLVLSFALILMVFMNGLMEGWNRQSSRDLIEWKYGAGQYWLNDFDRHDPLTIDDAHRMLTDYELNLVKENKVTPKLIRKATAYPHGRLQSIIIHGVDADQSILKLPSSELKNNDSGIMIGKNMANSLDLKQGDNLLIRWRDSNGTFDAKSFTISTVFDADVAEVDYGIIYMNINTLQDIMEIPNHASILTCATDYTPEELSNWNFQSQALLLKDLTDIIEMKKGSSLFLGGMLLLIGLLVIFDSQVLAVFRRQKEIGTYIALGMTRQRVMWIFTLEGTMNSILASILAVIIGFPICYYLSTTGINMFGDTSQDIGITIPTIIYPYYAVKSIVNSALIVIIASAIVSYMPSRKIAKLRPTEALKGKS